MSHSVDRFAVLLLIAAACITACEPSAEGADAAAPAAAAAERGRYLVEGVLRCFHCHSERDWTAPGAPPGAGREGTGRVVFDDSTDRLVAPNLTPDEATGIGGLTDEELSRAIRQGIGRDGRVLAWTMPSRYFRHLSDDDAAAVIAYLRSREPVYNPLPRTVRAPETQALLDAEPAVELDPIELSVADPVERGRALMRIAGCQGCHTAWEAPRMPGLFGGGNLLDEESGPIFSTNITPHATGAPYDADAFIEVMRTGRYGALNGYMPWIAYRNLDDADLRAMHAFLRTMVPVAHFLNNHAERTPCEVCGQMHGLGELNRIERPEGVHLDPATRDRYVGSYRSGEADASLRITFEDGEWLGYWDEEDQPVELIPLSAERFLEFGGIGALRFEFGDDGRAVRIVTDEVEPIVLERVNR